MPKLHQVNALVAGKKTETEQALSHLFKVLDHPELFDGQQRTYKPYDEESGDRLPPEQKRVQFRAGDIVDKARDAFSDLWDLIAMQDKGNTIAVADVVVEDGVTILKGVPVTTFLFIEKQLHLLESFINKLPTPDPAEEWEDDANTNLLKTAASQSLRMKKQWRNHPMAEATKEHPAQVKVYDEDVPVGTWTKILFTGRIPEATKQRFLSRLKRLQKAVKMARENANASEVSSVSISKPIFDYVIGVE